MAWDSLGVPGPIPGYPGFGKGHDSLQGILAGRQGGKAHGLHPAVHQHRVPGYRRGPCPFVARNRVHDSCCSAGCLQDLASPFVPGHSAGIGDMKNAGCFSVYQLLDPPRRVDRIGGTADFVGNHLQFWKPVRCPGDLGRKMISARSKQPAHADKQMMVQMGSQQGLARGLASPIGIDGPCRIMFGIESVGLTREDLIGADVHQAGTRGLAPRSGCSLSAPGANVEGLPPHRHQSRPSH